MKAYEGVYMGNLVCSPTQANNKKTIFWKCPEKLLPASHIITTFICNKLELTPVKASLIATPLRALDAYRALQQRNYIRLSLTLLALSAYPFFKQPFLAMAIDIIYAQYSLYTPKQAKQIIIPPREDEKIDLPDLTQIANALEFLNIPLAQGAQLDLNLLMKSYNDKVNEYKNGLPKGIQIDFVDRQMNTMIGGAYTAFNTIKKSYNL